jgi:hypothetical protein
MPVVLIFGDPTKWSAIGNRAQSGVVELSHDTCAVSLT